MRSMVYRGSVMHCRKEPVRHEWNLPYCFFAIDVDEISGLERSVKGFGYNRFNLVSLRDENYMIGSGGFRERLARYVNLGGVQRVILVTALGFGRRVFNPVSFYYCLKDSATAAYIVAEVNNTYGDRHMYVMEGGVFPVCCRHDKRMHVSPFNDMNGHYEFEFSAPDNNIRIGIRLIRNGREVLDTVIRGRGRELTTRSLAGTLITHPVCTAKTIPRIFRQAALLYYIKRLKFNQRPEPHDPMTIKVRE